MGPIPRSTERILVKIQFESRPVLISKHHDALLFMVQGGIGQTLCLNMLLLNIRPDKQVLNEMGGVASFVNNRILKIANNFDLCKVNAVSTLSTSFHLGELMIQTVTALCEGGLVHRIIQVAAQEGKMKVPRSILSGAVHY